MFNRFPVTFGLAGRDLRWRSLALACALGLAMLLALPVALTLGQLHAAVASALLCLVTAQLALAISYMLNHRGHVLGGLLCGMLLRTGLPLVAVAVLYLSLRSFDQSALLYLLWFYPVSLFAETVLSLPSGA